MAPQDPKVILDVCTYLLIVHWRRSRLPKEDSRGNLRVFERWLGPEKQTFHIQFPVLPKITFHIQLKVLLDGGKQNPRK